MKKVSKKLKKFSNHVLILFGTPVVFQAHFIIMMTENGLQDNGELKRGEAPLGYFPLKGKGKGIQGMELSEIFGKEG